MLLIPKHGDALERLAQRIRLADAPSRALVDDVIANICTRPVWLKPGGQLDRLDACLASGAWTDAAIALIARELPAWSVWRLVRDDTMWLCSLSRSPNLPIELDDMVEASHEVLPLAILAALVEARRTSNALTAIKPASVPAVRSSSGHRICCDNFS